jgi:hypothetical protein
VPREITRKRPAASPPRPAAPAPADRVRTRKALP